MAQDPIWLRLDFIQALHDRLLAEHGGREGVRSQAGLEAALARPHHLVAYSSPDLCALAAAYAAGIVQNHPFVDGNKRTAFMAAYVFLRRNGIGLIASEKDATSYMMALAGGDLSEQAFADWLRQSTRPSS